jgi:hypothetical protein
MMFVATAAAVGAVVGAFAGPAEAQGDSVDSAGGNAVTVAFRPIEFFLDVHSGPSGENPSGLVSWVDRVDLVRGPVTCLNVTGNRATIGFANQEGPLTDVVKGGYIYVEDNGTPGVGKDKVAGRYVTTGVPTVCPPNTIVYRPGDDGDTVTSGELNVHDAPPLPTRLAQCRHGGWRAFGVFRSQGDCVRSVRHRARQACIFERVAHGVVAFRAKYGIGPRHRLAMWACVHGRIGF